MAPPRKYSDELRERAVRLYLESDRPSKGGVKQGSDMRIWALFLIALAFAAGTAEAAAPPLYKNCTT